MEKETPNSTLTIKYSEILERISNLINENCNIESVNEAIKIINLYYKPNIYDISDDSLEAEIRKNNNSKLNDEETSFNANLLSLRITANTILKKEDDVVREYTRQEKFPYIKKIDISNDKHIHLIDKSMFNLKCDAYVNSIHQNAFFDYSPKSFSCILKNKIGENNLEIQIKEQKESMRETGYLLINHPSLSALRSYHLPIITNDNSIDKIALQRGLEQILKDIINKKWKTIGFVAIGTEANLSETELIQHIELIAKIIANFLRDLKSKGQPEIYFAFINFRSFQLFEEAFNKYSLKGQYIDTKLEELKGKQKDIIELAHSKSQKYCNILKDLSYFIDKSTPILLLGETGVGKSFIAENLIHTLSSRSNQPFKSLNCGALTKETLDYFLFGYDPKGLQSIPDKEAGKSIFELAEDGTVFLDEIGCTSLNIQQALLLFLDTGKYRKPGSSKEFESKARLIFGTNEDLEQLVKENRFRLDFYERITKKTFNIPPLRERSEDIEEFINISIKKFNNGQESKISIEQNAISYLQSFLWPGNIRQLDAYIQSLSTILCGRGFQTISRDNIIKDPPRNQILKNSNDFDNLESLIKKLLDNWDYNKTGRFTKNLLEPIVAKLSLELIKNKKITKSDSIKIIGIDGSHGGNESDLDKAARLYDIYKKYFE